MGAADFLPRSGQQRGRELPPASPFAGDDGTCPPALAAALATEGPERIDAVVLALATSRVLVPVVAHEETGHEEAIREKFAGGNAAAGPGGSGDAGGLDEADAAFEEERHASASMVTVKTPDGREALPVFSSVDAMRRWRPDARPVPHQAVRAAMAAVDEAGGVMVLDAGDPAPAFVPRPAVWALARGEQWTPSPRDPAVIEEIQRVVGAVEGVRAVEVHPGGRAEVKVALAVVPGLTREQVQEVAGAAASALGESALVAERVDSVELALTTA